MSTEPELPSPEEPAPRPDVRVLYLEHDPDLLKKNSDLFRISTIRTPLLLHPRLLPQQRINNIVLTPCQGDEAAAEAIANSKIDVVVIDLIQKDGKILGLDTIDFCRDTNPQIPFILITGGDDNDGLHNLLKEHLFPHLHKPFDFSSLINQITEIMTSDKDQSREVLRGSMIQFLFDYSIALDGQKFASTNAPVVEEALRAASSEVMQTSPARRLFQGIWQRLRHAFPGPGNK